MEITADPNDDIVYIRFNSMMFFEPDEATLLKSSLPIMDFIGSGLKENEKKVRSISICGHTADITDVYKRQGWDVLFWWLPPLISPP